ncbi:hypothetical protein BDN72DRAFT_876692 [Pluteus cervinus]|uniref:Uncharacterized protein n=1 Tax=Pluteus cervinus TaxID=181527 RepID=A0ACD3B229_9AGAR|nr:hypothetical protein BDN72DRAFT_876692 [Pluteus cervinus]
MTNIISSPRLPPELEYTIFLLAYQNDSGEAKNLVLVARRVFDWLIPHIFHVVVLSDIPVPIKFNEEVYQKYGHHVRHLFLHVTGLQRHLHMFPNVINLALWVEYNPVYLPTLLQLPLTCISTGALDLFQVFVKLTHLDLCTSFEPNSDIKSTLYLPQLTHLCVLDELPRSSFELFLERERCPQLKVVIVWVPSGLISASTLSVLDGGFELLQVDDKRVVGIKCHARRDWETGARGGEDMWKVAEGVVISRRAPRIVDGGADVRISSFLAPPVSDSNPTAILKNALRINGQTTRQPAHGSSRHFDVEMDFFISLNMEQAGGYIKECKKKRIRNAKADENLQESHTKN